MRTLSEDELRLRPLTDDAEAIPQSELLVNGAPTRRVLSGVVLEAAIACAGRYLLLLTSDTPYEEMLDIHLLDAGLRPLDYARLGALYSTGHFCDLRLLEPNRISFQFIGEYLWEIEILPQAVFNIPYVMDPTGIARGWRFRKYLKISATPLASDGSAP